MIAASRKEFLGSLAMASVFAGCTSGKCTAGGYLPTKFTPYHVPGLEPKPDFWRSTVEEIIAVCENAKKCSKKEVICRTPLGYPVYALFYGDFSEPAPQTNWSAGHGSTTWRNYYGNRPDGKQTFLFFAGVHGAEPETVVGAVNLIQMLETGKDFSGKSDPELLEFISKYRLIVVPCVNMDGRAISPPHLHGVKWDTFRRVSQGEWKDGQRVGWRGSKSWFPLPLDKVNYPGGYPNADGYNIMHDACPGDLRTEEAKALLKLASRWRVDAVLNGHSYEHVPSVLHPTAIDYAEKRDRSMEIRYECNLALHEAGIMKVRPKPPAEDRPPSPGINLNNLLSLASGAIALTLECSVSYDVPDDPPSGRKPSRLYTFEELFAPVNLVLKAYLKNGLKKPFLNRGPDKVYGD